MNAAIQTSGLFNLHAKDNVIISAPILNHSSTDDSRSMKVSIPALDFKNMIPLYSDYKALQGSQGGVELGANSWNAALDAINVANNALSAMRLNSVSDMFHSLSSMISADLTYTRTRTRSDYQTVASNVGVQCGGLAIDAGNSVLFTNGVSIHASCNANIHAKFFGQYGAALQSAMRTQSESVSVGVSLSGDMNAGASVSGSGVRSTTYANQLFQVGGQFTLNAGQWNISDANLLAGSVYARVDDLSVISHANTSSSYSWSASANTNGCVSFQHSANESRKIGTPSGISASNGIDLTTKTLSLEGAKITSNGSSHIVADRVESKDVEEYNRGSSFGVSGNVNDLSRQPSSSPGQQPFSSVGLCLGKQDYQAVQQSTVFSAAGDCLQAGSIAGQLNTRNSDGLNVSRDDHYNAQVKIPVMNLAGIQQLKDNVEWAGGKLFAPKLSVADYGTRRFVEKTRAEIDLDVDDLHLREYGARELSEVASGQRQARNVRDESANDHSYLLDPDRQAKYKNTFFDRSASKDYSSQRESGFIDGLEEGIVDAYKSPDKWSAASIDKLSETTKHLGKEYKLASLGKAEKARKAYYMPVEDALAGESSDIGFSLAKKENVLADEFLRVGNQLGKFSFLAKGSLVGLDLYSKWADVVNAQDGQRGRVGFVKGSEFFGEWIGAVAGEALVGLAAIPSAGTSFVATPVVTVASAAAGDYLFKQGAEWLENKYDSVTNRRG